MSLLSKDDILSASDLRTETVKVPEWAGSVRVRSLTGAERDAYEQSVHRSRNGDEDAPIENIRASLVAVSVVDKSGERVFSESDVSALGEKNAAALNRVWNVARRLSGLTEEDVEELEGNSEGVPSDDSTSP